MMKSKTTRRARATRFRPRSAGALVVTTVAVVATGSIASADVPNLFESGETLTALALNENFDHLHDRLADVELSLAEGVPLAIQANTASVAAAAAGGEFAVPGTLAVAGDASVGGSLAVAGTLSIGLTKSTNCNVATYTDCTCPAGHVAISGGAYAGSGRALDESLNTDASGVGPVWRLGCRDATFTRVACQSAHAICARLGM